MTVCKRVRTYLDEHGMVPKEVAQKADIPYPAFDETMASSRKMYPEELLAICYALNVKPEVFIETKTA